MTHTDRADTRYGITYWYTNTAAGGKLRDMQYAWALFNTMCAVCGVWVYLLWNEAVMGVHRDRRVFRQKVVVTYLVLRHDFNLVEHECSRTRVPW